MRSVIIDAAALEAKQTAFFASKNLTVATGLLIGRMTATKDHIVSAFVVGMHRIIVCLRSIVLADACVTYACVGYKQQGKIYHLLARKSVCMLFVFVYANTERREK